MTHARENYFEGYVQARIHDTVPDTQAQCDISSYGVKQHSEDARGIEDGFRKFIVAKDNFATPPLTRGNCPGEGCTGWFTRPQATSRATALNRAVGTGAEATMVAIDPSTPSLKAAGIGVEE